MGTIVFARRSLPLRSNLWGSRLTPGSAYKHGGVSCRSCREPRPIATLLLISWVSGGLSLEEAPVVSAMTWPVVEAPGFWEEGQKSKPSSGRIYFCIRKQIIKSHIFCMSHFSLKNLVIAHVGKLGVSIDLKANVLNTLKIIKVQANKLFPFLMGTCS